jgi:hypothetical protein
MNSWRIAKKMTVNSVLFHVLVRPIGCICVTSIEGKRLVVFVWAAEMANTIWKNDEWHNKVIYLK